MKKLIVCQMVVIMVVIMVGMAGCEYENDQITSIIKSTHKTFHHMAVIGYYAHKNGKNIEELHKQITEILVEANGEDLSIYGSDKKSPTHE